MPVQDGELRITRDGGLVEIQMWAVYPGREMMRGAVTVGTSDLRVVLHALKYSLWDAERAEMPRHRDAA